MRFAVRVLALPAALTIAAAAPPDPLAAIAAANGHPALVHLRAVADSTLEGRRQRLTLDQFGPLQLERRCIADACSGSWFDGRRLWAFGLNDVALPVDTADLPARRTLAAIASLAFAEPAFRAGGGTAEPAGGGTWRVRAADGAPLVVSIDPATRALRTVTDASGAVLERFSRTGHAGSAAFALERSGLQTGSYARVETVPEPLDPPDGAPAAFAGEGTVPLLSDRVPIVPCTLGGRDARCLLDSGATPSALTLNFAEALGLEPRGELEIAGFSRFVTGFVDAPRLAAGAAAFERLRLAVIPAVAQERFDVVVGADLLARVHVAIDRARRRVRITAPQRVAAGEIVPLRFDGNVPLVDASFDGAPVRALLDTGDAAIVSLGYADYRRGPQWPLAVRVQAQGVAGGNDAFIVTIPQVRIGPLALGATRATVNRTQTTAHVGAGMWSRCTIELDERDERLGCAAPP
ncbi:hypothetical protein WPS_13330 [Vulcanimicrobium alpinum]|uniref:Peptidase A2 domain-containing protein n=1 Tax=Vulcanimicrobium alpinum TaxID=3016050 RepID=A0AAN2C9X1_UNVUL|nr:hypothetical protein WPS_13330 [Vulcanimicrobium alpinum]